MKKIVMILLVAALLISAAGCKAKEEAAPETTVPVVTQAPTEATTEATTEPPTEPPTEPVPACMDLMVMVNDAPAVQAFLNRGDLVQIVAEADEDYFLVQTESYYGFMEKQLVRHLSLGTYETWTGYAKSNASLYDNYKLSGEPAQTLSKNTELSVLAELNECYLVQKEETFGYVKKAEVSDSYIRSSSGGGGGNSSSGGGGGNSGSGGGGNSSSGGADGGDITLSFGGIIKLSTVQQVIEVGPAEVLVEEAPLILGHFYLGNTVSAVVEEGFAVEKEGYYTLYLEGEYAYLPENLAQPLNQEETYAQWDGFAAKNARLYDNYLLLGEGEKLNLNTEIKVLWENEDFYVVNVEGNVAYMKLDAVNLEKVKVSSGGGGNSSSGGGGNSSSGGGGNSSSGGEWTPPAL